MQYACFAFLRLLYKVPSTLKQEGESCGYSRLENCGNCGQGLECDTFVEDACGVCIPGELYEINAGPTL